MGENEMTLMRLRRLARAVMSKNERYRFESRELCRSNIVKFLESHLMCSSEKVRYLALELFCCTIPRLANKTDSFLRPILPKVFQCLQRNEAKDTKLKALHFLRGFFRHTKSFSCFIDNFVRLGIENSDPDIQISCCLGLNIVFDQDIGNNLFSHLVISVSNLLIQRNPHELIRAAYRVLKHIHITVGDDRFFRLLHLACPEAIKMYKNLFHFEESDSFLASNDSDCGTLVYEYQKKRRDLNFSKDFGILDPVLLDQIQRTKNCDRAKALSNLVAALKRSSWTEDDLDPHIVDFLKIIRSFTSDSNRLIQMFGFDLLKEVIKKMGFMLSPHIRFIVEILQNALVSTNSKIRSKANRVLHKLMSNIHPMTVMWELLCTESASVKEAVLLFIQEKICNFPYHEIDMVALCNHLGQYLEDKNVQLVRSSRDCMILLFDVMRCCPVYGLRTEAVRVMLRNYKLSRETLKDIGVLGNSEDEYTDNFESYSGDETTDMDTASNTMNSTSTSISLLSTHRSISTAGESKARYSTNNDMNVRTSRRTVRDFASGTYENFPKICKERPPCEQGSQYTEHDLASQSTILTANNGEDIFSGKRSTDKTSRYSFVECPKGSRLKEQILSATDLISETTFYGNFEEKIKFAFPQRQETRCFTAESVQNSYKETNQDLMNNEKTRKSHESRRTTDFSVKCLKQKVDVLNNLIKCYAGKETRKYFTPFCMRSDPNGAAMIPDNHLQETHAGGDADDFARKSSSDLQKNSDYSIDSRFITESYVQDGIQVDVLNKDVFNFNVLKVERQSEKCLAKEIDGFNSTKCKSRKTISTSNKARISHSKEQYRPTGISAETYKSKVDKQMTPKMAIIHTNDKVPSKPSRKISKFNEPKNQKFAKSTMRKQQGKGLAEYTSESIDSNEPEASKPVPSELITRNTYHAPIIHSPEERKSPILEDSYSTPNIHSPAEQYDQISIGNYSRSTIHYPEERNIPISKVSFCTRIIHSSQERSNQIPIDSDSMPIIHAPGVNHSPVPEDVYSTPIIHSSEEPNSPVPKDSYNTPIVHSTEECNSSDPEDKYGSRIIHSSEQRNITVPKDRYCTQNIPFSEERMSPVPKDYITTAIYSSKERNIAVANKHNAPAMHSPEERKTPYEQNIFSDAETDPSQGMECDSRSSASHKDLTPFLPKSRQLPRTPVEKKKNCGREGPPKCANKIQSATATSMKTANEKNIDSTEKPVTSGKSSLPSKWSGCQWRRDLEYAYKAAPCLWAEKFEHLVNSMKPFPTTEEAENEMKKAIDELYGKSWQNKEEAMPVVIRLAKHHPEIVNENASKIIVALSNEVKNIRQSVAGKAIITAGYLYEIMGKAFENKLRLVVGALLAKSGNKTLAAYFRLVIKSLIRITSSTSPQKAVTVFIQEGSRHSNKAARETAAQFITILTRKMGPASSLSTPHSSSQILKCAANFVLDSSALTRYCGMCMFEVLMKHPDFEKMKDHHIDISTVQNLTKILKRIKAKGISEEPFPINVID